MRFLLLLAMGFFSASLVACMPTTPAFEAAARLDGRGVGCKCDCPSATGNVYGKFCDDPSLQKCCEDHTDAGSLQRRADLDLSCGLCSCQSHNSDDLNSLPQCDSGLNCCHSSPEELSSRSSGADKHEDKPADSKETNPCSNCGCSPDPIPPGGSQCTADSGCCPNGSGSGSWPSSPNEEQIPFQETDCATCACPSELRHSLPDCVSGSGCCASDPSPKSYKPDQSDGIAAVSLHSLLFQRQEIAGASTDISKTDDSKTNNCGNCVCYRSDFVKAMSCDPNCCNQDIFVDLPPECSSCLCPSGILALFNKNPPCPGNAQCCPPGSLHLDRPKSTTGLNTPLPGEQENAQNTGGSTETEVPEMTDHVVADDTTGSESTDPFDLDTK